MSIPRNFGQNMCYHLVNRIAHRALYFDAAARSKFVDLLWRAAEFSGMEILAYCVMSNHFHILAYLPTPVPLSDDEILGRLQALYRGERLIAVTEEWRGTEKNPAFREMLRKKYLRRMWSATEFMRTLLQYMSISFNHVAPHIGRLWEGPFRAKMIDPADKPALRRIAAYIDRNPVKAGLTEWPEDYAWCGFAAACKGKGRSIGGYASLYSDRCTEDRPLDWDSIREAHGNLIAEKIHEMRRTRADPETPAGRGPVLGGRGGKVALGILARLLEGPLRPAELRRALGVRDANFFTAHYLTPLESAGLIALADGSARFSPMKRFVLTANGAAALQTP